MNLDRDWKDEAAQMLDIYTDEAKRLAVVSRKYPSLKNDAKEQALINAGKAASLRELLKKFGTKQ